ncbi:MAG: hypothetical protein H0U74_08665 [Bradymonadaceae bacterium]|nr:hypothetical protein [Lujinxingiaceae bacterium]
MSPTQPLIAATAALASCGDPDDRNADPAAAGTECASWSLYVEGKHIRGDQIKRTKGSIYYGDVTSGQAEGLDVFGIEFRNATPTEPSGVLSSFRTEVPVGVTGTYRGYFSIQDGNGQSYVAEGSGSSSTLNFTLNEHTSTYVMGSFAGEVFVMGSSPLVLDYVSGVFEWSSHGCAAIWQDCESVYDSCSNHCSSASSDALEYRGCWTACADDYGLCTAQSCLANENLDEIADTFISRCRQAKIRQEFPSQLLTSRLGDIKKGKDADSKKAWKLLNDNRFAK